MSSEITTHFVQQYTDNVYMLAQQKGSRLREKGILIEDGVVGKSVYIDNFGSSSANLINNRHGDSPINNTPHGRRKIDLADYDWGDLVDKLDKVKTLNQPENQYVRVGANAMGRQIDDLIITAALGTAYSGEAGGTSVTFPAAQQVAVNDHTFDSGSGNVGLTVGKLISAKNKLQTADAIDDDTPLYCVANARNLNELLSSTEVGSVDYNEVKALVKGEIQFFMGFNFIRSERLNTDGSGYRQVIAYSENALALGVGQDVMGRIDERADKRFATYIYFCMSMGATRLEEERVVEIKCDES